MESKNESTPEFASETARRWLLTRRDELLAVAETSREAADTVELDQTRVGRLSRMDAMQAQAMAQEANRRRAVELKAIAAALRRLDEGEYGYCTSCDEPIAAARLLHNPAVSLCLQCAAAAEKRL